MEFHDFLQDLPQWGKFHSALAMDDDMAEMVFEQMQIHKSMVEDGEAVESELRSPEGETPVLSLLKVLDEHVQSLVRITIAVNGDGKSSPPDIHQWPRPFTKVMELERAEESSEMSSLADLFGIQH